MRFDNLSSTNQRLIGTLLLLPLVLGFLYSTTIAGIFIIGLGGLMGWELSSMLGQTGIRRTALPFVLAVIAIPASWMPVSEAGYVAVTTGLVVMSGILSAGKKEPKFWIFGMFLALCLASVSGLLIVASGHQLILVLAAAIAACDTSAYFVGRQFGGPKLAPSISPKKTISGSFGGIIGSVVVMGACASQLELGYLQAVLLGVLVAALAQAGDLMESSIKRTLNVKDSGIFIPGHGGVLDRFDGYVLTMPAAFLFFQSGVLG